MCWMWLSAVLGGDDQAFRDLRCGQPVPGPYHGADTMDASVDQRNGHHPELSTVPSILAAVTGVSIVRSSRPDRFGEVKDDLW
jgi:hypothetical protein